MQLAYKRYIITGASSGLGRALVRQLNTLEGVQIVAAARHVKSLSRYRRSGVIPVACDVTQPEQVDNLIAMARTAMGGVDCVIACAGFGYYEVFQNRSHDHIARIFETNVIAPLYLLQRTLGVTTGEVSFVTVSSALGMIGWPGMSLYCATKYALRGFAESFRFEAPDRLHYMTVYPIGLKTPFWRHMDRDIPLPRPLQSADQAAAAILRGLRKKKRSLTTCLAFQWLMETNRFLPVIVPAIQYSQLQLFRHWRIKKEQ